MYPMPTPQMPPYAPATSLFSRGMMQGGAQQLSNLPVQQGVLGQSGGLLSRLFGGAQAGGGGLTNITSMLQNAQKAIGVFQQVSPLVQQYGPLVKSLPALINIMRDNGSSSDNESELGEESTTDTERDAKTKVKKKKQHKSQKNKPRSKKQTVSKQKKTSNAKESGTKKKSPKEIDHGIPAPKLYI